MQQGKMFFFIGLLMAVLQGGVVRRLPLGSEQKVHHLWRSHIFHLRFLLSVCHDGSTVDCAQFRHCWFSLLTSNIVSVLVHDILKSSCEPSWKSLFYFSRYLGLSLYAISTAFVVPMLSSLVSQYGGDHQKVSSQSMLSIIVYQGRRDGRFSLTWRSRPRTRPSFWISFVLELGTR